VTFNTDAAVATHANDALTDLEKARDMLEEAAKELEEAKSTAEIVKKIPARKKGGGKCTGVI
jgi:hypothetical protein